MLRAIHIFPPEYINQAIESIRKEFDPLYSLIDPHITLVFPFESKISTSNLDEHVKNVLMETVPFKVMLQGITGTNEGFLFLNVKVGNDHLISLHDKLYTGLLKPFLNRKLTYVPHLTVGRVHNEESMDMALAKTENIKDTFEFLVNEVVVEEIDPGEKSIIISKIAF